VDLYAHVFTNFSKFTVIFIKMATLTIFTISSFESNSFIAKDECRPQFP